MLTINFTKSKLPYGWMGNMSPYPIKFGDETYRTTEALFQALRFSDNDIKELIKAEKSPMGAKFVAKSRVDQMTIKQLSDADVDNMRLCVRLKVIQYPNLLKELLETGDVLIVEDVTNRGDKGSNTFWGAMLVGEEWIGQNILGKIWMQVRKEYQKVAI